VEAQQSRRGNAKEGQRRGGREQRAGGQQACRKGQLRDADRRVDVEAELRSGVRTYRSRENDAQAQPGDNAGRDQERPLQPDGDEDERPRSAECAQRADALAARGKDSEVRGGGWRQT